MWVAGVAVLLLLVGWYLWTPDLDRATLEAHYLAAKADLIDLPVAGGTQRLHVRDSGPRDAPAVILIHGFGASLHTWDAWAKGLEATHRVVRFDLPGSGLSAPDPAGDYSDAKSRALLIALMDRLGIARASLVGHSIGGRIAWGFAAREPQRVDRLVLVAPDGFASPGFAYGQAPQVPASLALMRWVMPKPLVRMSLAPAYANPAALGDADMQRYYELARGPGVREALLARMAQTVLEDPKPWLAKITAPTLLLWGEQDAMIPIANAAEYEKGIAGAKLASLPKVGHLPQEEAAAASLVPLADFLR